MGSKDLWERLPCKKNNLVWPTVPRGIVVNRLDTFIFPRVSITNLVRIIRYILMYLLTFPGSYAPRFTVLMQNSD